MKKRITSLFLCFLLFINICFCFSVPSASAYSIIDNPLTDNIYVDSSSNVSQELLEKIYRAFAKNPHLSDLGIESGSDFICFVYKYPNQDMGSIQISSANVVFHCDYADVFSSNSSTIVYSNFSTSISESNLSNFESMNFSVSNIDFSTDTVTTVIRNTAYNNRFCIATVSFLSNYVSSPQYNRMYSYAYGLSIPFSPSYEEVPLPFYSLDVDSFYDWIINNNKLVELPVYITQAKLKSFLEFYKSFGSSNTFFISKIADWFAHMNIANQSMSNITALKQATDKLYQEYIKYRSGTHAYWPNATKIQERDDIDTKTDNNNVTLVTDDTNDTLDISILRDILRGVIAISNNVNQGCANIVQKLDELNFIVNVVNDGGDNSLIDLSSLYIYDSDAFSNDLQNFEASIEDVQSVPQGYINTINQNALMPENLLEDKNSLTVNIPTITGFTVGSNGSAYSTQTGSYVLSSSEYPWLDSVVQKIKRFASIILILGYLVHLRYRIPELIRGE